MPFRYKQAIQQALRRLGYELHKTSADVFAVQRELIGTHEPVILDVGAHVGTVARRYRQRFPQASIHCFEPFPPSFGKLRESLDGDPRSVCHNLALSEKEGTAALQANRSSATNSLLPTDERGTAFWGEGLLETTSQIEVPTTTLDAFSQEAGFSHIDILKLDVQGAEFAVLQGARDVLTRQSISLIYTELILCPTYKRQHPLHEYLAFLDGFGYGLLDFYNPVRRHHQLIQADAIFLSASLLEMTRTDVRQPAQ